MSFPLPTGKPDSPVSASWPFSKSEYSKTAVPFDLPEESCCKGGVGVMLLVGWVGGRGGVVGGGEGGGVGVSGGGRRGEVGSGSHGVQRWTDS